MTPQQPSRDPLDVGPGGPVSQALAQVVRLHRTAAGELLKSTGLYPGQEVLMMHLWAAGVVRQADLINALGLDPSTVTKMLQRLQRAGKGSRTRPRRARRTAPTAGKGCGLPQAAERHLPVTPPRSSPSTTGLAERSSMAAQPDNRIARVTFLGVAQPAKIKGTATPARTCPSKHCAQP